MDQKPQDSLAEWSKALAPGASPQGRGLEPHSCHVNMGCLKSAPCRRGFTTGLLSQLPQQRHAVALRRVVALGGVLVLDGIGASPARLYRDPTFWRVICASCPQNGGNRALAVPVGAARRPKLRS